MTFMYELFSLSQWNFTTFTALLFCLSAFIAGFTKAGLPGGAIVAVPLMAMAVPPRISLGVILPVFMVADVFSVYFWHRYAERHYCFPYLLFIGLGVIGAWPVMGTASDSVLDTIIGWLLLVLITLSFFTRILRPGRGFP